MNRLPPHSNESEEGLLGCLVLDASRAAETRADWFYDIRRRKIFDRIQVMQDEGKPIDLVTLAGELQQNNEMESVGGYAYVMSLPDATPSPVNWQYFAGVLREMWTRRRIIAMSAESAGLAYDQSSDLSELLDKYETDALGLRHHEAKAFDMRASILDVVNEMDKYYGAQGRIMGIATGYYDLDRILGGLNGGDYMVIAARPSVGKTALAMNIVEHVAIQDRKPVGVFSLEMTTKQLLMRATCSLARVSLTKVKDGQLPEGDFGKLSNATVKFTGAPIVISDTSPMSIGQVRAMARRWKQANKIELLVIDYLQLMQQEGRSESRRVEIGKISNGIKAMAKELDVPVIVLSQLNRDADTEGRTPRLSDLRESGDIEQDADMVCLLQREEKDSCDDARVIKVLVAKNRNGSTGIVEMMFLKDITRFELCAKVAPDE